MSTTWPIAARREPEPDRGRYHGLNRAPITGQDLPPMQEQADEWPDNALDDFGLP